MRYTPSNFVIKTHIFLSFIAFTLVVGAVMSSSVNVTSTTVPVVNQAVVVNSTLISPQQATIVKTEASVRLPRTVLPRHYQVRLLPVIEEGNFTILGRVSIDMECLEDTDRIVLHSADILVDPESVQVTQDGNNMAVDGIEYDTKMEFLIFKMDPKIQKKLNRGLNYTLSMSFVGDLNDKLKGFYRSTYDDNGVKKFIAVTQMEPTDARRAFPCFDEPNMKATFSVTLGRPKNMIALSNMPLASTTPIEEMKDYFWDHFEKSVPMSTYLVAFIVGNFQSVKANVEKAKWSFNIYAQPSAVNQMRYASEVGPQIQAFLEDHFQIPYSLPKQDMIAIPDFAGAMENWGLITYRESALLYDEKISSVKNKQSILRTISHELAHQWFGNLVTMDWWTDLWLKEGFATYVEYLGGQFADPSSRLEQQVVIDLQKVMDLDALESSHPISVVVHHPDEIDEIFDQISYEKGASVIRMLANFVGENTFRKGLTSYLKSREYGNSVQDDLWEAITQQGKFDKVQLPATVKQIMDTWTLKMGYPVVTVMRDYNNKTISLYQDRYLKQKFDIKRNKNDETAYLWFVPLTYTSDFETFGSTWLADNQSSTNYSLDFNFSDNQWLIFNINQTGFYRVNYDLRNWKLITQQLKTNHEAIPPINRAQIMNDALNLAYANLLDFEIVLELTLYLERERDFIPWESALTSLEYISSMMSRTSSYGLFKKHMRKLINPVYNLLGFHEKFNEPVLDTKLRVQTLKWACLKLGNMDCINNSKESFKNWMSDPDNNGIISPNLKTTIMCTAIREGGDEEWDFVFDRYLRSNVAGEKDDLLQSLTCSRQPWILSRLLEMSLNTTSQIRKQDVGTVLSQVAENDLGSFLVFNFIRERLTDVKEAITSYDLREVLKSVTKSFNTGIQLKDFLEFQDIQKTQLSSITRATEQSIDTVKSNLNWMKKNFLNVVEWLQLNYS